MTLSVVRRTTDKVLFNILEHYGILAQRSEKAHAGPVPLCAGVVWFGTWVESGV